MCWPKKRLFESGTDTKPNAAACGWKCCAAMGLNVTPGTADRTRLQPSQPLWINPSLELEPNKKPLSAYLYNRALHQRLWNTALSFLVPPSINPSAPRCSPKYPSSESCIGMVLKDFLPCSEQARQRSLLSGWSTYLVNAVHNFSLLDLEQGFGCGFQVHQGTACPKAF